MTVQQIACASGAFRCAGRLLGGAALNECFEP